MSGSREALFTLTKVRGTRRREANAQVEEKRSFPLAGSVSCINFYLPTSSFYLSTFSKFAAKRVF